MLMAMLLGVFVGAVLGLTGAGGGLLAVPALVVGMGWSMQQAAPVALLAVAGGAAVGAAEGLRKRLVRYKAAMLMALAGIPVTSVGHRVAESLPQRTLLVLFAAVMLLAARRLWAQARSGPDNTRGETGAMARIDVDTGRFVWSWPTAALLAGIGALTGFMTGLLSVGGGLVMVPLLRRWTDVTMHGIVATSLLVIALVGLGGVFTSVLSGAPLPALPTALFAAATAGGMLVGRQASGHLSARQVQLGFATLLVLVACGLLLKAAMAY